MAKLSDGFALVCRPCAEAKGATFLPTVKADYSVGQCKFCKSAMHVVYPAACWEWPEKIHYDARAADAETI
jgi:hypothetical protein